MALIDDAQAAADAVSTAGWLDPNAQVAVRTFQENYNSDGSYSPELTVDGKWGADTKGAADTVGATNTPSAFYTPSGGASGNQGSGAWGGGSSAWGGGNPNLTMSQLVQLAKQVGMADPVTAAAIAMAESGGNPDAIGDLNLAPNGSVGLWQVYTKVHTNYDINSLHDPSYNAKAAYDISSKGTHWTPWSTFTNGAYKKHLADAQAAFDSLANAVNTPAGAGIGIVVVAIAIGLGLYFSGKA